MLLVRRMPKNATYKMWQDDLMLIMTAAQGMHPVRDNFGAVKIIKTESEMPARVTTQTQLSSDGKTEVNVIDYLIMDTKTIVYRTHKTRVSTGEVRQKIPDKVFKKIEASLVASLIVAARVLLVALKLAIVSELASSFILSVPALISSAPVLHVISPTLPE